MLGIQKISTIAIFATAPIILWGCGKEDSGGGNGGQSGGDSDGTADAEAAIKTDIGDGLYANYDGKEGSRDDAFISTAYDAVIAATIKDIGSSKATDALKTWKKGDEIPDAVEKYIGQLLDGSLPLTDKWTQADREKVVEILQAPAVAAIKAEIGKKYGTTDQKTIDDAFTKIAADLVTAKGPDAVNKLLSGWKEGEELPADVETGITDFVNKDPPKAEAAIKSAISEALVANYADPKPTLDSAFVAKAYAAVVAAVAKELGEEPANQALRDWKENDDIPEVVEKYLAQLLDGSLPLTTDWVQADRDEVAKLLQTPAINAIKAEIKKQDPCSTTDAEVDTVFDAVKTALVADPSVGAAKVNELLVKWKKNTALPTEVTTAFTKYLTETKNGADLGASAAEIAIRADIGDKLYANYVGTEGCRDKAFLTKAYKAVKAESLKTITQNDLDNWTEGSELPAAVKDAIGKLEAGSLPLTDNWKQADRDKVAELLKEPAVTAIKAKIGKKFGTTDPRIIDAAYNKIYDDLVKASSADAVDKILSGWKDGEDPPPAVENAIAKYVAANPPAAEAAIKTAISDDFYSQYDAKDKPTLPWDAQYEDLIGKSYAAVVVAVVADLGEGPALKALRSWETGQPIPDPVATYMGQLRDGTLKLDTADQKKLDAILTKPAIDAIKAAIGTGDPCVSSGGTVDPTEVDKVFNAVKGALVADPSVGAAKVNELLVKWKKNTDLPKEVTTVFTKYLLDTKNGADFGTASAAEVFTRADIGHYLYANYAGTEGCRDKTFLTKAYNAVLVDAKVNPADFAKLSPPPLPTSVSTSLAHLKVGSMPTTANWTTGDYTTWNVILQKPAVDAIKAEIGKKYGTDDSGEIETAYKSISDALVAASSAEEVNKLLSHWSVGTAFPKVAEDGITKYVDDNPPAAKAAIKTKISDDLVVNYAAEDKPTPDPALVGKAYDAVVAAVVADLGEEPALKALRSWEPGQAIPVIVVTYEDQLFAGTLTFTADWTQSDQDSLNAVLIPAIAAIKTAIGTAYQGSATEKQINDAYDGVKAALIAASSSDAVNKAIRDWIFGSSLPVSFENEIDAWVKANPLPAGP